jgi:hypothetical protein
MIHNAEFGNYAAINLRLILFIIIGFQVAHSWFGLVHDNIYEVIPFSSNFLRTISWLPRCWHKYSFRSILLVSYCKLRDVGLLTTTLLLVMVRHSNLIYLPYPGVLFLGLYIAFCYPLHREYSWIFFSKAGADPEFRTKYR